MKLLSCTPSSVVTLATFALAVAACSSTTSSSSSGSSTTTGGGATCGTATCAGTEYCSLTYDATAKTFSPGSCKALPSACASTGLADICTCMMAHAGCSTSGAVKCSTSSTTALTFGCN